MIKHISISLLACLGIVLPLVAVDNASDSVERLYLKDFRPHSIYNVPESHIPKAKYPVIDVHSHVYERTADGIEKWIETMDRVGIEKAVIMTQLTGARFDSVFALYSKYPDRFEVWCGLDYTGYDKPGFGPAAVAELERCYRMGARGVGELGDKGRGLFYSHPTRAFGMHPDDPRMDPLFQKCAELNLPVNIHVADPIWMYQKMDSTNDGLMNAYEWRLDDRPDIVDNAGMLKILENTVKRHPRTTFIACHFANQSHDLQGLGRLFDRYPNLYADISARFAEISPIPRFAARFIEKYQDRLLYGTDMGSNPDMYPTTFRILESTDEHFYDFDLFSYHWSLYGLGLPDKVLEKLYKKNALKVLHNP